MYGTKTRSQTEQQLPLTDFGVCGLYQSPFFTIWIEKNPGYSHDNFTD